MMNILVDLIGWAGSLILILAYYQISRDKISAQSGTYHFLNILGSLLLIINTIFYGAYPSSAVNIIWVFIGLHYLIQSKKNGKEIH